MDQQTESTIIMGLRSGDADAWRALYDAYAVTVWRFIAQRMAARAADVPDVVQETFLAAARSARSFDAERGTILSWLKGIASRSIAMYFRKLERHNRICSAAEILSGSGPQVMHWLENRQPVPPEVLNTKELALIIRMTLSSLCEDYEKLLTWKYVDGQDVEQIAGHLNISTTAVRSKLARARRAFRIAFASRVQDDPISAPSGDEQY